MGFLVQFFSVIAFTTWGLYVWARPSNFGNNKQCNYKTKYVIFFFTVSATAPWLRGIWIAAIVLSAVGLMLSFGWKAMELFDMKREAEETAEKEWYFDISFTLLLCVAPLLSLTIVTHESLFSSAIYSTVMLELTVSGRISYSTYYSLNRVPGVAK
jgi:hypothetical protein